MPEQPTLGELMRTLDALSRQMAELMRKIEGVTTDAAQTYVRRDVYGAELTHVRSRLEDTEDELKEIHEADKAREKTAADTRRQLMFMVLGLALPSIAGLLLAVNNFLTARG